MSAAARPAAAKLQKQITIKEVRQYKKRISFLNIRGGKRKQSNVI